MQAVILVAGKAERLKHISEDTPQCLVKINNTQLLIHNLSILSKYDIKRFVLVVGHHAKVVREAVGDSFSNIPVEYIENALFDKTNNICSLWLTRHLLDQDTLLMEGDVFFTQKVIDELLKQSQVNGAAVSPWKLLLRGTLAEVNDNRDVLRIVPKKDQDPGMSMHQMFQTVNIYFLKEKFLIKELIPALDEHIKTRGYEDGYDVVLAHYLSQNPFTFKAAMVDSAQWVEVDDFDDLNRANAMFS